MSQRRFLFLALSRKGWGETSLGLEVARQVCAGGATAAFMAHSGGLSALGGSGFEVQELPDHMCPFVPFLLEETLNGMSADAIVLSDIFTAQYTLSRAGIEISSLLDFGVPVIGLDTWEYDSTGPIIDIFDYEVPIDNWIDGLAGRLVPAPIGRPTSSGAYCALAEPSKVARSVRRHIRQNLGLTEADRAVLFCTAGWQHSLGNPAGSRLASATPELLWRYLQAVDPSVRLIHVGPERLALPSAEDRYLWMPSVPPEDFGRLLGSVDLFLSANISATTVGRAVASGVPTLVVHNSVRADTLEQVEAAVSGGLSPMVEQWLKGALPIYPFRLWPLGYWRFLEPIMRDNPYCAAIETVELLDAAQFHSACSQLLFDRPAIAAARGRQDAYVQTIRRLPSAAQLINNFLN